MIEILPFNGDRNAIKTVTFAVEVNQPLDLTTIREVISLHDKFKDKLPRKQLHQGVVVNLGKVAEGRVPSFHARQPQVEAVTFDRLRPDGQPEWALYVNTPHISVLCGHYDRWETVWPQACEYLRLPLEVILRVRQVKAIGLQYVDEFFVKGSIADFRARDIFRENTEFLTANSFGLRDLWHCHHGYFVDGENPGPHRQLNNVNVDLADANGIRTVRITTTHRATPRDPIKEFSELFGDTDTSLLGNYMAAMHSLNKDALSRLLNEERCRQIGLSDGA